jgi:hypothetical protein
MDEMVLSGLNAAKELFTYVSALNVRPLNWLPGVVEAKGPENFCSLKLPVSPVFRSR